MGTGDAVVKVVDQTAPKSRALAGRGRYGAKVELPFKLTDNSDEARARLDVYARARRVATIATRLYPVETGVVYVLDWRAPKEKTAVGRRYRFCVVASDQAGNRSSRSCAPIRLAK